MVSPLPPSLPELFPELLLKDAAHFHALPRYLSNSP